VIERTRIALRTSAVRHQLQAVAAGKSDSLAVNLDGAALDLAALVNQVTAGQPLGSLAHLRLAATFQRSGITDIVIDQLGAPEAYWRTRSAQLSGTLGLEHAVNWISPLLSAKEPAVRDSAARALGRIGGTRSAEALLRAIRREGLRRTLLVELARAAPDLFLEAALCQTNRNRARTAVAIAAGLRGRRAAVAPLLALLASGSRRERAASCRALGWLKAEIAVPAVAESLADTDWRVRMSAAKALARLGGDTCAVMLEPLRTDPNMRVRKTVLFAMRRLHNKAKSPRWWAWR